MRSPAPDQPSAHGRLRVYSVSSRAYYSLTHCRIRFFITNILVYCVFLIALRYDEVEVLRARVEAEIAGHDSTQILEDATPAAPPSSSTPPQAAASIHTNLATPEATLCEEISSAPKQQVFMFSIKFKNVQYFYANNLIFFSAKAVADDRKEVAQEAPERAPAPAPSGSASDLIVSTASGTALNAPKLTHSAPVTSDDVILPASTPVAATLYKFNDQVLFLPSTTIFNLLRFTFLIVNVISFTN